ncbi:MAG: hypothetical protein ACPGQS_13510, partial [Bradymonadia bacterium]
DIKTLPSSRHRTTFARNMEGLSQSYAVYTSKNTVMNCALDLRLSLLLRPVLMHVFDNEFCG